MSGNALIAFKAHSSLLSGQYPVPTPVFGVHIKAPQVCLVLFYSCTVGVKSAATIIPESWQTVLWNTTHTCTEQTHWAGICSWTNRSSIHPSRGAFIFLSLKVNTSKLEEIYCTVWSIYHQWNERKKDNCVTYVPLQRKDPQKIDIYRLFFTHGVKLRHIWHINIS